MVDWVKIDIKKVVVPKKVSCNNGKDCRYILGWRTEKEAIIPKFFKTPKHTFGYDVSKYDNSLANTMNFNVVENGNAQQLFHYQNISSKV